MPSCIHNVSFAGNRRFFLVWYDVKSLLCFNIPIRAYFTWAMKMNVGYIRSGRYFVFTYTWKVSFLGSVNICRLLRSRLHENAWFPYARFNWSSNRYLCSIVFSLINCMYETMLIWYELLYTIFPAFLESKQRVVYVSDKLSAYSNKFKGLLGPLPCDLQVCTSD